MGVLREFEPWRDWGSGPIGTITDDTQMTMCVAETLLEHDRLDPRDLARRFVDWLPQGRGKGRTCVAAVSRLTGGLPWWQAGEPSAGNGAAMRVAPVGVFHATRPAELRRDAALSAVVTHRDPTAVVSAVAQAFLVAHCLHRPLGDLHHEGLRDALYRFLADIHHPPLEERRPDSQGKVRLLARLLEVFDMVHLGPDEAFTRLYNGAFVLESLPAALWSFLHSPSDPEQVVITAANGGYDADTVASMAGALAGALNGAEAWPRRWLNELEFREELTAMADGLLESWEQAGAEASERTDRA